MLTNGTGVQSTYYANQQVMVGVPNRPFAPTIIVSKMIDPEYTDFEFVPGETFVSLNKDGFIVPGIKENAKAYGLVIRGASNVSKGTDASVYTYGKGAVPILTQGNVWINVTTAPTDLYQSGVAISDSTGKATCYDSSATAGIFTCGKNGATLLIWQAITAGSFGIKVDGADDVTALTALDFSNITELSGVATVIQAALDTNSIGATVAYDSENECFVFTSETTGASSSVVLSADTTGTSLYTASYLNAANGTETDGEASSSPDDGYTALPLVSIEKWSPEVTTKVLVTFPMQALTA